MKYLFVDGVKLDIKDLNSNLKLKINDRQNSSEWLTSILATKKS